MLIEFTMKRLYSYFLCCLGFTLLCLSVCPVSAQAPARPKIVFTSTVDGNAEIYMMNTDGSGRVRLTNHPGDDFDPAWSPTGEHIAFVSERDHLGLYDIYLMDANGGNIRRAFGELDYRTAPAWSPDGEKIAYHTYSTIPDWAVYFSAIGGGTAERVSKAGIHPGGFPDWSPDGTKIAFTGGTRIEWRIWIRNLQTGDKKLLLPNIKGGDIQYPAWSPDGQTLAFYWWKRDEHKPYIYIVNRDGKKLEKIVENVRRMVVWSPDGKELLYKKRIEGQIQLVKINLDSRISTPLASAGPITRHGQNTGWDWFDPAFALPVSPKPHLLTTVWAKVKTTN